MSIVGYYARLNEFELQQLIGTPSLIWSLFKPSSAFGADAEGIDVDCAYEPIAWLLSACARLDSEYSALLVAERGAETSDAQRAMLAKLKGMEPEPIWTAIYGSKLWFDERLTFGLGPVSVVSPDDVGRLNAVLERIAPEDLRRHYDAATLDRLDVRPGYWLDEGEDLMTTFIKPSFLRLKKFYFDAAKNGQVVLTGRG